MINDRLIQQNNSYDVYYVKNDYTNSVSQLVKINTETQKAEIVYSGHDYFSSVAIADKIYLLSNNWIGYVENNKIHYLMSGDEYTTKFLLSGDTFYYGKDNSNVSDDYFERFAMMKTDGTSIKEIHESGISQLLIDDYIYFKPNSGVDVTKLLRYNLDGTNKQVLLDQSIGYLIKSSNRLYFVNYSDNSSLYQMNLDGSNVKKLVEGPISFGYSLYNQLNGYYSMAVIGDVLYYINTSDGNKLYKVESGSSTKVSDAALMSIQAKDSYLFVVYKSKFGIYMWDSNGKELKTITTDNAIEFSVE